MFRLTPQPLEFVDTAPLRVVDSAVVRASPERVFRAFADTASWPKWFPLMTKAKWVSDEHEGVGSEREVSLIALGTYREKFIAWEPGKRFAFTMTRSSSPLAKAIVEDFRFSPESGGNATRIDWVLAANPRTIGKVLEPVLRGTMMRVFQRSGPKLQAYLSGK